jgi:tetratricopeptide (TPR) repeat protein
VDATLPRELIAIVERALAKPKDERYQQMGDLRSDLQAYRQIMHADSIVTGPISVPSRPSSDARRLSAAEAQDLTQPVTPTTPIPAPGSGGPGSGGLAGGPGSGRPPSGVPVSPGPVSPGPVSPGPVSGGPASGGSVVPLPQRQWRLPLIVSTTFAVLIIAGGWLWVARRPTPPPAGPAPSTAVAPPEDPGAGPLRQAREAVQSRDYASALRYADAALAASPGNAEARQIRDTSRARLIEASLQEANAHLAAGDFAEASRAAGAALALEPGNAEAKRIMERGSTGETTRSANEARLRMVDARSAAQAAGASKYAAAGFRTATRTDQEAQRLFKAGRLSEAMSRFYEASGLYRSAETTARSEAAAAAAASASPSSRQTPSAPAPPPPAVAAPVVPPPASPPPAVETSPDTQKPPTQQQPAQPPSQTVPAPPQTTKPEPAPAPPPPVKPQPAPTQQLDLPQRSPTAEERIQELLARYKAAMESRSIDELKRIWPGMGAVQQSAQKTQFQQASSISVDVIDPHVQVSGAGTTATVTFTRRFVATYPDGPQESDSHTVMEVRRNGNTWVIESIRFR